jgi:hypothetical protein
MDLAVFGRSLIVLGIGLCLLGGLFVLSSRLSFLRYFGRLPGDIRIQGENFSCFAPIVSMLLLSLLLSLALNIAARMLNR